jgi:uncharacterized protein YjbI with pentapeptide repeats
MRPTWKKYLRYASLVVAGGILAFMLIETIFAKRTGFETKTLWDWMELLIVPLVLAGGALLLNRSEKERERENADKRIKEDRRIAENRIKEDRQLAEDRAKLEREIAMDRQQEAALQAYLDRMTELVLDENLKKTQNEDFRNIARIRTLTTFRALDGRRKGVILLFLKESGLLELKNSVNLRGADIREVLLTSSDLSHLNLSGATLNEALFWDNDLSGSNLSQAYFLDADLSRSNFSGANLSGAFLMGALLEDACLVGANLSSAYLYKLQQWHPKDGFVEAYTNLSGADLTNADLRNTSLRDAVLTGVNLTGADLSGADLTGATVTSEQLAMAEFLKGATMPDGTKHKYS